MLYTENNEVTNVDKHIFELEEDGCVDKEKIVELLQEKRIYNDKKYFIKNIDGCYNNIVGFPEQKFLNSEIKRVLDKNDFLQ